MFYGGFEFLDLAFTNAPAWAAGKVFENNRVLQAWTNQALYNRFKSYCDGARRSYFDQPHIWSIPSSIAHYFDLRVFEEKIKRHLAKIYQKQDDVPVRNSVRHKLPPEKKVLQKTCLAVQTSRQKGRYTSYRLNMTQLRKLEASVNLAENCVLPYIKEAIRSPSDISPRLLATLAAIGDLDLLIRVENIYSEARQRILQPNRKNYPDLALWYRNTMRGAECDSLRCPLFAAILHRNETVARHLICVSRPSKTELKSLFTLIGNFVGTFKLHIPEDTPSKAELRQVHSRLAAMLNKKPRR